MVGKSVNVNNLSLLATTLAVLRAIGVVIATAVAILTAINGSKNGGHSDDQTQESHGIVDCRSNIAADSNSMEGLGSVPLLS